MRAHKILNVQHFRAASVVFDARKTSKSSEPPRRCGEGEGEGGDGGVCVTVLELVEYGIGVWRVVGEVDVEGVAVCLKLRGVICAMV